MNSSNLIYVVILFYYSLKNYSFKILEKFLHFPSYFPPFKVFPFPPLQIRKALGKYERHCEGIM